jgi:hypothetical protein
VNLKDWLNYRKNCPICDSLLTTYLHSKKRQSIRYEEGRVIVVFPLTAKGKTTADYKVGFSFGLGADDFCIEFYDKNHFRLEKDTPTFLIKRFKELHKNQGSLKFYRLCNGCNRYNYTSKSFLLKFDTAAVLPGYEIRSEYFGLIQNYGGAKDDRYRVYRLLNYYDDGEGSYLDYWITNNAYDAQSDSSIPSISTHLQLPLIKFVSQQQTLERIQKLITFS